jgi:hypothetical protein
MYAEIACRQSARGGFRRIDARSECIRPHDSFDKLRERAVRAKFLREIVHERIICIGRAAAECVYEKPARDRPLKTIVFLEETLNSRNTCQD